MPHPLAVLASPLTSSSPVGHTISSLLNYSAQTSGNKMTKAFVLFYMVAFVASRASAFAPASTRTQSFVAHNAAKQQQQRANKPLFMSDDDVSFKCSHFVYRDLSIFCCFATSISPQSSLLSHETGLDCPQVGHDWRRWCKQRGRTSF